MCLTAEIKKPIIAPKKWYRFLRQLTIFILAAAFTLYLGCPRCLVATPAGLQYFLFSFFMFVSLTYSNIWLSIWLDNQFPWLKNPAQRLIISIVATLVISTGVVFFINFIFALLRNDNFTTVLSRNWRSMILGPIFITFLISLLMHSRSFLLGWRQTAIDAEKLKGENITSQYETLKNQVNPHFLFNSLNTLTSLVHVNPDLSVKFIKQLSDVYRYVLDSQNKEVVDLATEIKFVQAYVFLQQIRFGNDLKVNINVPANSTIQIPPLSLQMLLENAVKHNIILEDEPLLVAIYVEEDQYIVVKNNLQMKNIGVESSGLGLKNIKARYEYLTSKPVHIGQTKTEFMVKLPVLQLQKA